MNFVGVVFVIIDGVKVMIDVIGFGLFGYFSEVCCGVGVQVQLCYVDILKLLGVEDYIVVGVVLGGIGCNFVSYGYFMGEMLMEWWDLLCDLQIFGGLLLVVILEVEVEVQVVVVEFGIKLVVIGELVIVCGG